MEKYRKQRVRLWILSLGFTAVLLGAGVRIADLKRENQEIRECLEEEIQQGIAKEVFRLHVVANSDEKADQELKMKVKNEIVDYVKTLLGEDADRQKTKETVLVHLPEIEERAEKIVRQEGFAYPVKAVVEQTYFPDKTYGDCTFPKGSYEALNVRIGRAAGHNWWCVLYPSLCFIEDTYGVVTEEKKGELKTLLTEEEYRKITGNAEEKGRVKIGFRWF